MLCTGTAGWAIPKTAADRFAGTGSQLERYARVFNGAEVNSTFKHEHRPATWLRWAASTPPGFRFSVKLPHRITHAGRLADVAEPLARFRGEIGALGDRLGPLLVQLPPSLGLDLRVADGFFNQLRRHFSGAVVCEPRHADWFSEAADALYARHHIARVAADPARLCGAGQPGGWLGDEVAGGQRGVAYFRWHGAPVVYRSSYPAPRLAALADELRRWDTRADCWCIFDNTASGAAAHDALALLGLLRGDQPPTAASHEAA